MKNTNTVTLRKLLQARDGHHTYTATTGKNGNGGQVCLINDILTYDVADQHLDDYTQVTDWINDDLDKHIRDATGAEERELEDMAAGNGWVAFDCAHKDNGILTGSVSRIYVNLAV